MIIKRPRLLVLFDSVPIDRPDAYGKLQRLIVTECDEDDHHPDACGCEDRSCDAVMKRIMAVDTGV